MAMSTFVLPKTGKLKEIVLPLIKYTPLNVPNAIKKMTQF